MPSLTDRVADYLGAKVPTELAADFRTEIDASNLIRLRLTTPAILILSVFWSISDAFFLAGRQESLILKLQLLFDLILFIGGTVALVSASLTRPKKSEDPSRLVSIVVLALGAVLLILAGSSAGIGQGELNGVLRIPLTALGVATIYYLPFRWFVLICAAAWAAYFTALDLLTGAVRWSLPIQGEALALTVAACLLARILFAAKTRTFLALNGLGRANAALGREIEEKEIVQEALRQSNENMEERIRAASAELMETNHHLLLEIADRERAESALKESEERFRSLTINAPDLVFTLDREGVITYGNPAWWQLLGYRAEDVRGRPLAELTVGADAERGLKLCREVWAAGRAVHGEDVRLRDVKGAVRVFRLSGGPNFDAFGRFSELVFFGQDMTERLRLENQLQQAQKMEAVGTLASGIAHDFNNILQAVSGYVQLIETDAGLSSDSDRFLRQIEQAAARASDLVKRLLTFSRKVSPDFKRANLNEVVVNAVGLLERVLPKMIEINLELDHKTSAIMADPGQIEQILMNLGANARDAMPEGGRLIIRTENCRVEPDAFSTGRQLKPGTYVRLTVADTGQGMDDDTAERIFEPFFTTKEVGRGTGLGLATVYGIVKAHRGYIDCASRPGEGAVFEILFPAARAGDGEEPVGQAKPVLERTGRGETILMVDDDHSILEIGRRNLTGQGYRVLTACSGEEALGLFDQDGDGVDLVILDLGMPGMGGLNCLKELVAMKPGLKVLVASGYASDDVVQDVTGRGAAGFFSKPYRLANMIGKIQEVLDP